MLSSVSAWAAGALMARTGESSSAASQARRAGRRVDRVMLGERWWRVVGCRQDAAASWEISMQGMCHGGAAWLGGANDKVVHRLGVVGCARLVLAKSYKGERHAELPGGNVQRIRSTRFEVAQRRHH